MVQGEHKNDLLGLVFAINTFWVVCLISIFIFNGIQINKLHEEVVEAKNESFIAKEQAEETKQECKRMTDTCIDILSNKRWN